MNHSNTNSIHVGGNNSGNITLNNTPQPDKKNSSWEDYLKHILWTITALAIGSIYMCVTNRESPEVKNLSAVIKDSSFKDISKHDSGTWVFHNSLSCTLGTNGSGRYSIHEHKSEVILTLEKTDGSIHDFVITKANKTSFETKDGYILKKIKPTK